MESPNWQAGSRQTGATNDYRDAWFIGIPKPGDGGLVDTTTRQASVPRNRRAALRSGSPEKAHADRPPEDFIAPEGILFKQIDPRTGLPSTEVKSVRRAFLPGTEPRQYCNEAGISTDEPLIHDEAP
jgi:membrane carboxypeptidase/penicillin-binding protein